MLPQTLPGTIWKNRKRAVQDNGCEKKDVLHLYGNLVDWKMRLLICVRLGLEKIVCLNATKVRTIGRSDNHMSMGGLVWLSHKKS